MLGYGYCRYSSHMQDEKSIEQQKMEIEEYAQRNNIQIVEYYIDEAKTATVNDRDGFQNMISDACKNKKIECVLIWKTDRFARNTQDSLYYRNKLLKHGTKLISITQPIDDSTPEGKLMSTMLAGMDEYYSQNLASNIRRAQKLKAKNIEFQGGIAPLGYKIVDKHYEIDENEAYIVKTIFKNDLEGEKNSKNYTLNINPMENFVNWVCDEKNAINYDGENLEIDDRDKLIVLNGKMTMPEMSENMEIINSLAKNTALFIEKYLISLGYEVDNTLFKDKSVYFRNALVRSNYFNNYLNIKEDSSYLVKFYENLLLGKNNNLHSQDLIVKELFD